MAIDKARRLPFAYYTTPIESIRYRNRTADGARPCPRGRPTVRTDYSRLKSVVRRVWAVRRAGPDHKSGCDLGLQAPMPGQLELESGSQLQTPGRIRGNGLS